MVSSPFGSVVLQHIFVSISEQFVRSYHEHGFSCGKIIQGGRALLLLRLRVPGPVYGFTCPVLRSSFCMFPFPVPCFLCAVSRIPCPYSGHPAYRVPFLSSFFPVSCVLFLISLDPILAFRVPFTVFRFPLPSLRFPCRFTRFPRSVARVPCSVFLVLIPGSRYPCPISPFPCVVA